MVYHPKLVSTTSLLNGLDDTNSTLISVRLPISRGEGADEVACYHRYQCVYYFG